MPSSPLERKPWPMRWIVLAIVVSLGLYTYLTLHYRKSERAYRPYEDMKNRANTLRLLEAGFQRVELVAERPAEPTGEHDNTFPAPGGIPADLKGPLVSVPLLPTDVTAAHAASTARTNEPYPIVFRCSVPDDKQQLAGAEMYLKPGAIIITPDFELLSGGLLTRDRSPLVALTVAPGVIKPGEYRVTLVGQRSSRSWTLDVK